MFIGRWQNWHKGHEWLISQQLNKGKNVWIAIRDIEITEEDSKTPYKVMMDLIEIPFINENIDKILISIIPDIESINYGRNPNYEVIYHEAPKEISDITGFDDNGYIDSNGDVIIYNIDKK